MKEKTSPKYHCPDCGRGFYLEPQTKWHTGTPTEDGDYLCVFDDSGYLYGWCIYRNGQWGYLSGYDPNVYHMVAWQKIEPYEEENE